MKTFLQITLQIVLTIAVFAAAYHWLEASTSVKVLLSYIVALTFSKIMDKVFDSDGDEKEKLQVQKERIDELENDIEMLNEKFYQLQNSIDELVNDKLNEQ